ncbi:MFS transporter [Acidisphaera sp. L21]|uniref:MFS transporter n=1 Tax=Acidisphaera sp. L21 TaxID=1641851 RepID=UPI00131AD90D|nr:MFS transporter [Acidisphaera sp. L21]
MSASTLQDGVPLPQRYWAVLTIGLAVAMAVIDGAIANIALPTIAIDMHATPAASIWVINAYQLAVTVSLLPLASLGEIHGYRRVYQTGLAVFTIASLACAMSNSLAMLTAARVLQGLGAAGIMSVNSALTRYVYPRSMLGRGMGINALIAATCSALGPTVASGILAVSTWQWLFAINVPFGLIAFAIANRTLPLTPRGNSRFDVASAVLNALTLGLLVLGVDGYAHGEGIVGTLIEVAVAIVLGVLLVRRQLDRSAPLLPVDLLRIPLFRMSIMTSILSFASATLAFVSLPFHLQGTLGWTATQTGLLMTPWPVATAIMAPIAGRLADRYSAGILGGIGMSTFAVGLLLLATMPVDAGPVGIGLRMAICGLGFGFFQSPNNRAIVTSAPLHRSGGASGMLGTARLLGQTFGAALVALVFSLVQRGVTITLLVAAGFAACGALASLMRLRAGQPVRGSLPAKTTPER